MEQTGTYGLNVDHIVMGLMQDWGISGAFLSIIVLHQAINMYVFG